jgi:hypothetical protein
MTDEDEVVAGMLAIELQDLVENPEEVLKMENMLDIEMEMI